MKQPEVVLVLNSGSDYLEFELFRMAKEQRMLAKGAVSHIGVEESSFRYERYDGRELVERTPLQDLCEAIRLVLERCCDPHVGVLESISQVEAVGHRVVHGGERFREATRIDEAVKTSIEACVTLAPLHNPANLEGIRAVESILPGVPNVAVFDTAFHHSMPPSSYLYAVPYDLYEKYGIRKYGFHGCSHRYIVEATAQFLRRPVEDLNLITCHLGRGCSVAAVQGGKVLDTSMGMTPLPGLIMGTRSGDIDPAVILFLANEGLTADEIDVLLNKKSGLLGIAGIGSGEMRDIIDAAARHNEQAARALWSFVHRLVFYVGAYYTLLGGADAVVFTGGIGENSAYVRARVMGYLGVLGCHLDETKNYVTGRTAVISDDRSTMQAVVMPTNEELMIARETVRALAQP